MKTITTSLLLGLALCLVSCKSKEEQAREQALETHADKLETAAKATTENADAQAKADKAAADAQAESLKKAAEQTRDQK